jgi:hypothetical protein
MKIKLVFALSCIAALLLGACSSTPTAPPVKLIPFPGTPTAQCLQVEMPPKITDVRPETPRPGSEVTVIANGGYFQDNCGGYNESARTYQIYMDDEPVADLQCYVNRCEGKFKLSDDTQAGVHCMGVVKGTCQVKLEVAGK